MPKRRAVYNSIRSQMRANGELGDEMPTRGRVTVKKLRNQHMREALDHAGESVVQEWKEDTATLLDEASRAKWAKRSKRIQKKYMLQDAADSLYSNQRAEGADSRGIKFVELEEGIACKIIPIKMITRSGKTKIIESGFAGFPDGTIVTALFNVNGAWRWDGNINIKCMLPDGRVLEVPKTRLDPMTIDGNEESDDDLFAPEDD